MTFIISPSQILPICFSYNKRFPYGLGFPTGTIFLRGGFCDAGDFPTRAIFLRERFTYGAIYLRGDFPTGRFSYGAISLRGDFPTI